MNVNVKTGLFSTVFALAMASVLLPYSPWLGHMWQPTLCLRKQANNVTHRQRMPADQVSGWTPGTPLCRWRFLFLANLLSSASTVHIYHKNILWKKTLLSCRRYAIEVHRYRIGYLFNRERLFYSKSVEPTRSFVWKMKMWKGRIITFGVITTSSVLGSTVNTVFLLLVYAFQCIQITGVNVTIYELAAVYC